MKNDYAVELKNVSKLYNLNRLNTPKREMFYALKDISFKVQKGEIVGILGTNGSGKSTLSKILAGLTEVSEGEVIIDGEASLIAIKSGLKNQLTGVENIELKGALLGLSKAKIEASIEEIKEFSELGDFLYQPVKMYSSGMKSRLGFSISMNMEPDIILIDEALSVGDNSFNEKCFLKIKELQKKGRTIFFVSHSINELRKYCTKGIWIEGGVLVCEGYISEVCDRYTTYIKNYKLKNQNERAIARKEKFDNRVLELPEISPKERKRKQLNKSIKALSILILLCSVICIMLNSLS